MPRLRLLTALILGLVPALVVSVGISAPLARATDAAPAPTVAPALPMTYEYFTISGDIGDGPRPVVLQRFISGAWADFANGTAAADGAYAFTTYTSLLQRKFRVRAAVATGFPTDVMSGELTVTTLPQVARLFIERTSDASASVKGTLTPARTGRVVSFQYLSGSTWKTISTDAQAADGKLEFPDLNLTGLSQWSNRSYRLYSPAYNNAKSVTAPTVKFMPGPKLGQLGKNVVRVSLDTGTTPSSKGTDYPGVLTYSTDKGATTSAALAMESFGIRGSTTAKLAKKPWKIKFAKKQSPFGWPKGKRFNLLALFVDNTMVRDKIALDLAREKLTGMAWNSDTKYTELFINSQYMGSFLFTEAPKIGVDPAKPEETRVPVNEDTGVLLEADMPRDTPGDVEFLTGKSIWTKFEDPDEYGTGSDDINSTKYSNAKKRVAELEKALYSTKDSGYLARVSAELDLASTIDYYLLREFTKDIDADWWRSCDFYINDLANPADKFFMGPAWDFDRSAGADTQSFHPFIESYTGWYSLGLSKGPTGHGTHHYTQYFAQLGKSAAFRELVRKRWMGDGATPGIRSEFASIPSKVDAAVTALNTDAPIANDRARWPQGTYPRVFTNHVGPGSYAKTSTFSHSKEIAYVKWWYSNRYTFMNSSLNDAVWKPVA